LTIIPHNYLAFRYQGQTENIYFVEKVTEFNEWELAFEQMNWKVDGLKETKTVPHFLYHLSSRPIILPKPLRNGKDKNGKSIYATAKIYLYLDTILTSETLAEAKRLTDERRDNFSSMSV